MSQSLQPSRNNNNLRTLTVNQPTIGQFDSNQFNDQASQLLRKFNSSSPQQQEKPNVVKNEFDFNHYQFYDQRRVYDHKVYLEEFVNESKVQKEKIRKQLMELVYIQVLTKMNDEFPKVPPIYQENKTRWCKLFLKAKPLQDLMADFTIKIQGVLEKEIANNKEQLTHYIMHPRISQQSKAAAYKIKQNALKDDNNIFDFNRGGNIDSNAALGKNGLNQLQVIDEQYAGGKRKLGAKGKNDNANQLALQAQQKLEKDLLEVNMKNEEYMKILERVKNIDNLVEFMEDNTNEMAQDVEKFEQDFKQLEEQKETNHPLAKLQDLLDRWSKEDLKTEDEIQKFAGELWVTVSEFEKDLKESLKGHEIILAMKDHKYTTHIDWIKNKFGFYIDYYETTMNELKLRNNREMDRQMMQLADIESRLFNCQKEDSELAKIIYSEVKVKNKDEAIKLIHELKRIMAIMHLQLKQNEQEKNMMKDQINALEDQKLDLQDQIETFQQQLKYYQSITIKLVKDLDVFKDMPNTLKFIEEYRNDNTKQEDIIKMLQEKGFDSYIMDVMNNYHLYDLCIKELYTELYKMGVIPPQKISLRKKQIEEQKTHFELYDDDRNKVYDIFEKVSKTTNQILLLSSVIMNHGNQNQEKAQAEENSLAKIQQSKEKISPDKDKRNLVVNKPLQPVGTTSQSSIKADSSIKQQKQQISKQDSSVGLLKKQTTIKTTTNKKVSMRIEEEAFVRKATKRQTNIYRDITEEDNEDDEYLAIKYPLKNDDSKELKRSLRLNSIQIQELQFLIKRCLGKDLSSEESVKLFDSNVESFINSLNKIIITSNHEQLEKLHKEQQENLDSKSDLNNREEEIKLKSNVIKTKVPLGDCISLEYNMDGELFAFTLRPKIATYVFQRDENDISSLKEILKVIMYMNRLMSEGENLILGKKKTVVIPDKDNHILQMLHTPPEQEQTDSLDQMEEEDRDLEFKVDKFDQEQQVNFTQDDILDLIRSHLVDQICRIAPYQREKTSLLMSQVQGEKLKNYKLRGVMKPNGSDYTVFEYLKDTFDVIMKKVRDIPPFKRRVIDFKDIIMGKFDSESIDRDKCAKASLFSTTKKNSIAKSDKQNENHGYIKALLREEMTTTLKVLDKFLDDQSKGLKTISINDEVDLFPHNDIYPNSSENKQFPIQKISISQKYSNLSFHNRLQQNDYSSFKFQLWEQILKIINCWRRLNGKEKEIVVTNEHQQQCKHWWQSSRLNKISSKLDQFNISNKNQSINKYPEIDFKPRIMIDNQRIDSNEKVSTLNNGLSNLSQQLECLNKNEQNAFMNSKYDETPLEINLFENSGFSTTAHKKDISQSNDGYQYVPYNLLKQAFKQPESQRPSHTKNRSITQAIKKERGGSIDEVSKSFERRGPQIERLEITENSNQNINQQESFKNYVENQLTQQQIKDFETSEDLFSTN
ncbi:UNKNOWN [Stylonychia lemnae]|uniref:Uncharacterized protein n=1 Tax=Stylonychia lemnae TaxID=5949 RepID=A0A078B8W8_STYLE|nr:UNKNOWN [Stylonychia lemnae]|eukprot:CDW90671.1 UNKNOWN [Stylonychia lemnae]